MSALHSYLTFNGNCEEAFEFYRSIFGGVFTYKSKFGDFPSENADRKLQEVDKNRIMHISLEIAPGVILMGSDTTSEHGDVIFGQNISLSLDLDSKEEADKIFQGLSFGGNITMSMTNTFWGAYFGMLTDKYGFHWLINYEKNQ